MYGWMNFPNLLIITTTDKYHAGYFKCAMSDPSIINMFELGNEPLFNKSLLSQNIMTH